MRRIHAKNNKMVFQKCRESPTVSVERKRGIRDCCREPNSPYDGANGVHDHS